MCYNIITGRGKPHPSRREGSEDMDEMTDKQFDAILLAIINYAKDVRDIDKVIDYIEEMLTQTKKTGSTLNK